MQSVAQASFDAWVKYYRQDENTPNATVSYYTKGALVALCLDLTLRHEGKTTLDAVMRALWLRCQGGPMTESGPGRPVLEAAGAPLPRKSPAGCTAPPICRCSPCWQRKAWRCWRSRPNWRSVWACA